jgi:hypothetical protein
MTNDEATKKIAEEFKSLSNKQLTIFFTFFELCELTYLKKAINSEIECRMN